MNNPASEHGGATAVFHDLRDIAWTPVQRQRNANGSESVVREKWPIIRPGFLSAYVHYESGMVVRRHGHRSNHVVVVLEGGVWLNGVWYSPLTHVHVPLGAAFGPIVAGHEGVTCWELSFGEFGGWGDQPELYEREIAARGVSPLPDPPLDLGEWFKDPRGDWGTDRPSPKVAGLAEVFTSIDDVAGRVVQERTNADGTVSVIRQKLLIDEPTFTSACVEFDPNMSAPSHPSHGLQVILFIDGGAWFGERWCPTGTHVEVPSGAMVGPIVAGDQGARLLTMIDTTL